MAAPEGLFIRPAGGEKELGKLFPAPSFFTASIDGAAVPDKAALMEALAAAFKFPAYFGKNWDALLDCLRSLHDELPAEGYVLAVRNSGKFLAASPADMENFTDVAAEAREFLGSVCKARFVIALL